MNDTLTLLKTIYLENENLKRCLIGSLGKDLKANPVKIRARIAKIDQRILEIIKAIESLGG